MLTVSVGWCFSVALRVAGHPGHQPGGPAQRGHHSAHQQGLLQPPAAVPRRARCRLAHRRRLPPPAAARALPLLLN